MWRGNGARREKQSGARVRYFLIKLAPAVFPLLLFVGRKFVRFSQPQFHKNSLKKESGPRNVREEREVFAHGWRAVAQEERCQLGRKQAASLSPITPADLPMSWWSKFINLLRTKLFSYRERTLASFIETRAIRN